MVYFAKFNINEKIYEVYKKEGMLNELLNTVFREMNTDIELVEVKKNKTTNYKFIQLDKNSDEFIVNGRLVAYAPGTHVSYDSEKDDVIETKDNKKASYVTFSFDTRKEIIGFVPKQSFGRKQFIERFTELIEKTVPEVGEVEIILENDKQLINEKLNVLSHINEIVVDLIPPNNDKDLFKTLYGINPEELDETGGNKFTFIIKGSVSKGINKSSKYIKKLINGVIMGYGRIVAKGRNTSGEPDHINSEEQALYTKGIENINKDNIPMIEEKTRAGYVTLSVMKTIAKEELLNQKESLKKELLRKVGHEKDLDK